MKTISEARSVGLSTYQNHEALYVCEARYCILWLSTIFSRDSHPPLDRKQIIPKFWSLANVTPVAEGIISTLSPLKQRILESITRMASLLITRAISMSLSNTPTQSYDSKRILLNPTQLLHISLLLRPLPLLMNPTRGLSINILHIFKESEMWSLSTNIYGLLMKIRRASLSSIWMGLRFIGST